MVKIADVDWNKHHLGEAEWEERQRKRYLRRLAQYHGTTLENVSNEKPKTPWAPLGSSKAELEASSPVRPLGYSVEPASVPSRTGSSWGGVPGEASLPPRTSSTTLTTLWRRALSTPTLRGASGGSTTSSQRERAMQRIRDSEAWFSACESMDKEELLEIVEHVHGKLLDERSKRRDVEAELNKSVSWSVGTPMRDGPPSTAGSRLTGRKRIANRQQTPAAHGLMA
mmetsp:Transcript_93672/g.166672  ORF Transcript_93672/g.166672 Transcript_93672/m.166672 type:complete len:226 (-) Transcript_93672:62-739(-)